MGRRRLARLGGGVVAVLAVALLVGGITRSVAVAEDPPARVRVVAPGGTATPVETAAPVADRQTVAVPVAAGGGAGSSTMQQTISLTILPGSMSIAPEERTVELDAEGRATVDDLTVVDARGSLAGWRAEVLEVTVLVDGTAVEGAEVHFEPTSPVLVHGNPRDQVDAGSASTFEGPAVLLAAASPGGGGGTYEVGSRLMVTLPDGADGARTEVRLVLAVR